MVVRATDTGTVIRMFAFGDGHGLGFQLRTVIAIKETKQHTDFAANPQWLGFCSSTRETSHFSHFSRRRKLAITLVSPTASARG
jgi:hypothetical protein